MKKVILVLLMMPLLWACNKEDEVKNKLSIQNKKIVLNHKEVKNIGASILSNEKITYKTEDKLTAEVDEDGNVTGGLVGDTKIIVKTKSFEERVKVIVEPKFHTFAETVSIGGTRQDVLNKHKGIKIVPNKNGKIDTEGEFIVFDYEDYYLAYRFKNNKVDSFMYSIKSILTLGIKSITGFLRERYILVGFEGNDEYLFSTKDGKIGIYMKVEDNGKANILYQLNK